MTTGGGSMARTYRDAAVAAVGDSEVDGAAVDPGRLVLVDASRRDRPARSRTERGGHDLAREDADRGRPAVVDRQAELGAEVDDLALRREDREPPGRGPARAPSACPGGAGPSCPRAARGRPGPGGSPGRRGRTRSRPARAPAAGPCRPACRGRAVSSGPGPEAILGVDQPGDVRHRGVVDGPAVEAGPRSAGPGRPIAAEADDRRGRRDRAASRSTGARDESGRARRSGPTSSAPGGARSVGSRAAPGPRRPPARRGPRTGSRCGAGSSRRSGDAPRRCRARRPRAGARPASSMQVRAVLVDQVEELGGESPRSRRHATPPCASERRTHSKSVRRIRLSELWMLCGDRPRARATSGIPADRP